MVEFTIKINKKQNSAYIPKELVEALGYSCGATHHGSVLVVYPKGLDVDLILDSLDILKAHFQLVLVKENQK